MSDTSDAMNIGTLLAEQLQRLLTDRVDRDALVAMETRGLTDELWRAIDELGVTLALVPEDSGGAGMSWAELEPALRAAGHYAAPAPLVETVLGNWALAAAGLELPGGPLAILDTPLTLDDRGHLTGRAPAVAWAQQSVLMIATATHGAEELLVALDPQQSQLQPLNTIGRIPTAAVHIDHVVPQHIAPLPAGIGGAGLLPHLATVRAVQVAGALTRVLDLCVDYGNTRTQFGKPIGKFQAIQHQLAELAEHTAAAQVAALYACRQIDAGNAAYGAAIAKTYAGRAATKSAAIAHQVFGAIGVTDEHLLHYFTRRLWQWRTEGGSEYFWSQQLGQRVLAQPGAALWPSIADSKDIAHA